LRHYNPMRIRRRRTERATVLPHNGNRRALIFDFDGTIADTLQAVIRIVNEHAAEYDIQPLTLADVEILRGMTGRAIARKYGIPITRIPGLVLRTQRELHRRIDDIRLFPGVRDLILTLKRAGFHLGILTSNSRENVRRFLRARGLDVFDCIHSESNLFGKRRALGHLLKVQGWKRRSVFYVGDEIRDIEACRKARVPVIAVSWGFHRRDVLRRSEPDFIVDTPAEIVEIALS
jgi:phosphoglycolate phosphatase